MRKPVDILVNGHANCQVFIKKIYTGIRGPSPDFTDGLENFPPTVKAGVSCQVERGRLARNVFNSKSCGRDARAPF